MRLPPAATLVGRLDYKELLTGGVRRQAGPAVRKHLLSAVGAVVAAHLLYAYGVVGRL